MTEAAVEKVTERTGIEIGMTGGIAMTEAMTKVAAAEVIGKTDNEIEAKVEVGTRVLNAEIPGIGVVDTTKKNIIIPASQQGILPCMAMKEEDHMITSDIVLEVGVSTSRAESLSLCNG
jgi:hypothetical protein